MVAVCALLKRLVDQGTKSALLALPPLRALWRRTRPCRRWMLAVSLLCLSLCCEGCCICVYDLWFCVDVCVFLWEGRAVWLLFVRY